MQSRVYGPATDSQPAFKSKSNSDRMTESNSRNSLAAEAGQPPSRDPEFMAAHNKMWRDLLFQPPCECDICLRQYRTKDQQQSYIHWRYLGRNRDPASLSQAFVKSIKEDRLSLYQTILASGPALLKRWRTGEARRKEYLTKAQPDIYPYLQPLIEIAYRGKTLAESWKLRVAYLLPYVNIEDLGKDSANFIPLLHYRTTFPPEDWVSFDNAQLQPGWKQGCYCEKAAEGCIVMQGEQYGTWREFDRLAVHDGAAYGAIRGLLILEAQQILMSFLRKTVITILKDANTSMPQERQPEAPNRSQASVAFPHYDLASCSKWMRFIEAAPHRDQAWLSAASVYTQQPYSAPTRFDIDTMIEIAETKAMETGDELWLLQTDLDYFHELMKRHEREWLDSVPRMKEVKKSSPKNKMDNIGYIMTVKVVIQAQDWQWLLEECQTVKGKMIQPEAKTRVGEPLPVEYERAMCGLQYLLRKAQSWYQDSLSRLFLKSQAFQSITEVTAIGKDYRDNWALGFEFKDYSQLYRKDRLGWCIYNLSKDTDDKYTFERSVVLQHLETFLETCSRQETERIGQEMYKCISNMAAVERMLSILGLHRPNFAFSAQNPFHQPSQAWRVHSSLLLKPSGLTCVTMDIVSALKSSARFRLPTGRRDKQWLSQRYQAQQNLSDLGKKARHAYQMTMEASKVSQFLIEPQLAMMKQGDSPENKAQLEIEKQQILGRLRAARQRALAKRAIPPKDTASGFPADRDQIAPHIQEPAK